MRVALLCPGDSLHTVPWTEELASRGHEVLVYAYPPLTQDFGGARVEVVEGGNPLTRALWLKRRVRQDDPDVLSQHYVATDAYAFSRLGKPLVLSVWGSDVLRDLAHPLKRAMITSALKTAALVVSPAMHVTELLGRMGVRADRTVTLQYGIDTAAFSPSGEPPRHAPVRVVCTRSLRAIYGNEDIIRALPFVPQGLVREVVFSGRGPLLQELSELAQELGVSARVMFLNGVESMPDTLRSADIYCSMSRSDGASLSLLEAMSCGLPVVVSDIPASREWVTDGDTGLIVPCGEPQVLADRLSGLASDAALRASMGSRARSVAAERGDRTKNIRTIVDAVEKAVGAQ